MGQVVQVYDNSIVDNYPIQQKFKISFADAVIRDSGSCFDLPQGVNAIDVDAYETSLPGDNQCTIDTAIGIADYKNNQLGNKRLLLVELRLNYQHNGENSSITEMQKKERHTRDILNQGLVDIRCFFIFNNSVAPRKRNEINRHAHVHGFLKMWNIVSPAEFNNYFIFQQDCPYQPITDISAIKNRGKNLLSGGNVSEFLELISNTIDILGGFQIKYQILECQELCKLLDDMCQMLDESGITLPVDDTMLYNILREELLDFKDFVRANLS